MFEDQPPHRVGDARAETGRRSHDDRAQSTRACQVAEALFAPKRQPEAPTKSPKPEPEEGLRAEGVRKPRILRALPQQAVEAKSATAPAPAAQPKPPKIPASDLPRIRAWLTYGMTVPQVAEVYGVPAADITRLMHGA